MERSGRVSPPARARRRISERNRRKAAALSAEMAASDFARGGRVTKTPLGTAPMDTNVSIVAHPTLSGPSGHLPLTGGVGPRPLLRETHTC